MTGARIDPEALVKTPTGSLSSSTRRADISPPSGSIARMTADAVSIAVLYTTSWLSG